MTFTDNVSTDIKKQLNILVDNLNQLLQQDDVKAMYVILKTIDDLNKQYTHYKYLNMIKEI